MRSSPNAKSAVFVVAGVHRILDDHLPEVGVLIGGYRPEKGLRHLLRRDVRCGGHVELLPAEAVDVAVEDRERTSGQFECEPGSPECPHHPVQVAQPRRSAALS